MALIHRVKRSGSREVRRARGGSVTVEMAIVAPILTVLLLGTIEMGMLMKDSMVVASACREGARVASLGSTTTDIDSRVRSAAATVSSSAITVTMQYRVLSGSTWGAWTTLTDSGSANAAPSGSQVMVSLTYPHALVTGGLFAALANPGTNFITVRGKLVVRRE